MLQVCWIVLIAGNFAGLVFAYTAIFVTIVNLAIVLALVLPVALR